MFKNVYIKIIGGKNIRGNASFGKTSFQWPTRRANEDANAGIQKSGDNYGKVPLYLQERKAEMAEEAARKRRAEENKKAPAGMSLMPEEERLDTFKILKDKLSNPFIS